MNQAPRWLPYRVRNAIDQWRIGRAVRAIHHTVPFPVAGAEAAAEVFMLVCRRDLHLAVVAAKSLLRFADADAKLAFTFINDGSLSPSNQAWIDHHIPGARWQRWKQEDDDFRSTLDRFPLLSSLSRKSAYAPIAKLLHPMITHRCDRVMVLDADTSFFKKPHRLWAFILGQDDRPLYLHDHQDEAAAVPPVVHEAFAELHGKLAPFGRQWQVQHRFFNSGLLLYRPPQLQLDLAEKYLQWLREVPPAYKTGKPGIWFGDWTPEQTAYHVMFALASSSPQPLGDDYTLGGRHDRVFNHFLRHYIVQRGCLDMISAMIRQLPQR